MSHPTSQDRVCQECGHQSTVLRRVTETVEEYECLHCLAWTRIRTNVSASEESMVFGGMTSAVRTCWRYMFD